MAQIIVRNQPINLTGLQRLKVMLPEARELFNTSGKLRRSGKLKRDDQIFDTLDKLAKETMETLQERGITLTVEDFLRERER